MKIILFIENAKLLNQKFKITPLLYGSLGLEYITNDHLHSDDIDILIPSIYINEKWDIFKKFLMLNDYILIDEKEHTFHKNGIHYSYASFEELETFAKINLSDIECKTDQGAIFKTLTLEQYLKVYTASSKDGYRINIRQKKDAEKIAFINKHLNENSIIDL